MSVLNRSEVFFNLPERSLDRCRIAGVAGIRAGIAKLLRELCRQVGRTGQQCQGIALFTELPGESRAIFWANADDGTDGFGHEIFSSGNGSLRFGVGIFVRQAHL